MYNRVYLIPFETDANLRGPLNQCPKHLRELGEASGLIGKESINETTKEVSWRQPYYVVRCWREKEADFADVEKYADVVRIDGEHAKTNAMVLTAAGVDTSGLTGASTAGDYRARLAKWLLDDDKADVTAI